MLSISASVLKPVVILLCGAEIDPTGGDFDATKSMEKWSYEAPPEVALTEHRKHFYMIVQHTCTAEIGFEIIDILVWIRSCRDRNCKICFIT